ncbi:restriction endonuclease subunit S [Virgibacillus senegalensis]|uniref:restriction endonuclease subunit S n=1 Tax=Virgibacillus senegalensis TaxID=1499679 RepID=UPI00069D4C35|nr:restriction endonuclease subunit S [Virgibacillus senegalensis]
MIKEKKLVPKRRFKGLKGGWRKEKLDDIANYRRGSFPQPYGEDKWYDEINGMPFVQVVDVAKNLKLVNNTKQRISKLAQPSSVYVEKGKVLVTLQGSIGRVAITQYPSYVDRTLLIFESYKFQVDTYYFAYIIQLLFDIEKQKAPGGTIKTITKEALSEFIVKIPCYAEQQKIGEFFKVLDERIAIQERKIAKVKALKSAYLTEMFPQEGETVPRRRFEGFEEKWVRRRVGDIFQVTRGNVLSTTKIEKKQSKISHYPVYSSQTQNNGLLGYYSDYLFDTAITWTTDGANAGTVNYREGKFYSTNVNGVLISKEGYACKAVAEILDLEAWKHVSKVGNPKLMNNVMSNIEIPISNNIKELEMLSLFFTNLDDQITTEEKKLEKLKKMKEAYLEEMFV